ncbi:MAG: recombinase family protein [Ruminococcus sp.]|nr:recombinase family protein [Ruminococcus sp.]
MATVLNEEGVLTPFDYYYKRIGKPNPYNHSHLWSGRNLENILKNPIYIGTLAQLRTTTVSYKNHQRIDRDESEWAVIENNHEAIISKELWDKVREIEKSVSRGKRDKKGELSPLSGLLFCDGCGWKMRKASTGGGGYICGYHNRFGKNYCSTHYINRELIEGIILADIQEMCELAKDEKAATAEFLKRRRAFIDVQNISDTKRMKTVGSRLAELDKLIQSVYEDRPYA